MKRKPNRNPTPSSPPEGDGPLAKFVQSLREESAAEQKRSLELEALRAALEAKDVEITRLKEEQERLQAQAKEAQERYDTLHRVWKDQEPALKHLREERRVMEKELEGERRRLTALQAELTQKSNHLSVAEESVKMLRSEKTREVMRLNKEIRTLQARAADAERSYAQERERIQDLEHNITGWSTAYASLETNWQEQELKVRDLLESKRRLEGKVKGLEADVNRLRSQLAERERQMDELGNKNNEGEKYSMNIQVNMKDKYVSKKITESDGSVVKKEAKKQHGEHIVGKIFVEYCKGNEGVLDRIDMFQQIIKQKNIGAKVILVYRDAMAPNLRYGLYVTDPIVYWFVEYKGEYLLLPSPQNDARFFDTKGFEVKSGVSPKNLQVCHPAILKRVGDNYEIQEFGQLR